MSYESSTEKRLKREAEERRLRQQQAEVIPQGTLIPDVSSTGSYDSGLCDSGSSSSDSGGCGGGE
jgi:hypothetical protein